MTKHSSLALMQGIPEQPNPTLLSGSIHQFVRETQRRKRQKFGRNRRKCREKLLAMPCLAQYVSSRGREILIAFACV
jgi:hypothetical protein